MMRDKPAFTHKTLIDQPWKTRRLGEEEWEEWERERTCPRPRPYPCPLILLDRRDMGGGRDHSDDERRVRVMNVLGGQVGRRAGHLGKKKLGEVLGFLGISGRFWG